MLTAFTLGILGSFHCIGMCGPIALALPVVHHNEWSKAAGIFLYNSGRILTYTLLGLLFGIIGEGIFMAGIQQTLSLTIGVVILLVIFLPAAMKKISGKINDRYLQLTRVKALLSQVFRRKNYPALFTAGVLNGLLPCGLVYLAVAGAIGSGSMIDGALFMAMFGAGTVPVMFSMMVLKNQVSLNFRNSMRKLVPVFAVIFAALFILRGLNLDIPYLSPKLTAEKGMEVKGCSPHIPPKGDF
jgi:uncharacterized protein